MRDDTACLISEFLQETQLRSLLLHQNFNFVFDKTTLETSRTAFVFTHQVCFAILAVIPLLLKIYKAHADFNTTWQSAYAVSYRIYWKNRLINPIQVYLPSGDKSQLKCRHTYSDRLRLFLSVADFLCALSSSIGNLHKFYILRVRVISPSLALHTRRATNRPIWANHQKVWQEKLQCSNCAKNRICTYRKGIATISHVCDRNCHCNHLSLLLRIYALGCSWNTKKNIWNNIPSCLNILLLHVESQSLSRINIVFNRPVMKTTGGIPAFSSRFVAFSMFTTIIFEQKLMFGF